MLLVQGSIRTNRHLTGSIVWRLSAFGLGLGLVPRSRKRMYLNGTSVNPRHVQSSTGRLAVFLDLFGLRFSETFMARGSAVRAIYCGAVPG